jgi:hypothetical protein
LSQGVVATVQGTGAALSNLVAGVLAVRAGYSVAFLTLAAIALAGLAIFSVAMPETRPRACEAADLVAASAAHTVVR